GLVVKFFHEISNQDENSHDYDVVGGARRRVRADDPKQQYQRKKKKVGNLQHFDPQADQRQIEDEQQHVTDDHAAEHAPKNLRRIFDKQRPGRQAVNQ